MDLSKFPTEQDKDSWVLLQAPGQRRMKLLFQAFLTRLAAVETGLADNDPDEGEWATPNRSGGESLILGGIDLTYAVVVTCREGDEPDTRPVEDYTSYDGIPGTTEKQPVCRHCLFERRNSSFSCIQLYHPPEGPSPWAPALASDGMHPTLLGTRPPPGHQGGDGNTAKKTTRFDPGGEGIGKEHGMREVVRPIRAVETGIVDVRVSGTGKLLHLGPDFVFAS
jgi:hypothetical protein